MSKYLFHSGNLKISMHRIAGRDKVLLFLDYDGTLAPFRDNPADALPLAGIRDCLQKLLQKSKYEITLISGRGLDELKEMLSLPGLNYAGSHGREIELAGRKRIFPKKNSTSLAVVKNYHDLLEEKFAGREGFLLEKKEGVITLHHPPDFKQCEIVRDIKNLIKNKTKGEIPEIIAGRQVVELRSGDWNKGRAVELIKKELTGGEMNNPLIVYIGDDRTDEDAFGVVNEGITVYVRNEDDLDTGADYYVLNPPGVLKFLELLIKN